MLAVLENMELRKQALPISVSTYHFMSQHGMVADRAELVRGVIFEKKPKSPLHTLITTLIYKRISLLAPDYWVRKEDPLTLADSEPEPDVSVVHGNCANFATSHPTTAVLIVEVAVTSAELDREKASLYAEAGVGEYWIVLAQERVVEIYTDAKDDHWCNIRRVGTHETIESTVLPDIRIALPEVFPA